MFFMRWPLANCLIWLIFGLANGQAPTPTPDQIREEVLVTINRAETRLADTPASVVTFSQKEIEAAAAPTLDDILRQTPGFSIFRRSSSRNANPTTQGVSLRGVGASGASRSLVLFDGVPLNDPFGGWVQWNRVPPIAVERVEILRGGASSLYGNAGLSGAINIIPRRSAKKVSAAGDLFGGTQRTLAGSGYLGLAVNGWRADLTAASFQTTGYRPVAGDVRGPVDVFAGSRSSNFAAKLSRTLGASASIFARPSYFGEVRTNGTGLQTNRTHIRNIVVGGDASHSDFRLDWRFFGGQQLFDQVFTAIDADRTAEGLTRIQRVPAQNSGLSVQSRATYRDHSFVGGVELRNVRGSSDEIGFANNRPTILASAGGRESSVGVFVQDFVRIGERLVIVGNIRFDRWRNYFAFTAIRQLSISQTATTAFPDRVETAISPQLSALWRSSGEVSLYASVSRSFRSPTLNELYRAFRVGNVLTLANEGLRAERSTNVEGGAGLTKGRLHVRSNIFWAAIDQTIANVTLLNTPNLITRQRQNAGETVARGVEADAQIALDRVSISGGYLFSDSRVTRFPLSRQLEGLRIPQVPRHQLTFQARVAYSKWTVSTQARVSSSQFDDDLNQFRLGPFAQIDLFVARRLSDNVQIYAAVENVFNSRYSIGRTPNQTVSSPTNARMGVRWK